MTQTYGYHLGRLGTSRDLEAIGERDYDKFELDILEAIIRERDRRDA